MISRLKNIISIFLLIIISSILLSCKTQQITKKEFNFSELKEFAQLATLECYFNNVATIKKDSTIIPGFNLFMDNSKTAIIEYQGIAKLGIDMGNVKYDEVTKTMFIPMAEVISVVDDPSSYDRISNDEGFWKNTIRDEDVKPEIVKSLDEIKETLSNNKVLLRKAQALARVQIESLVNSLYTMGGNTPDINYNLE